MSTIKDLEDSTPQLDVEYINRRILLMQQCDHLIKDISEEIVEALKASGNYRLETKRHAKQIEYHCREIRKDVFKNLNEKQTDDFINDLDDFRALSYRWAGIKENNNN